MTQNERTDAFVRLGNRMQSMQPHEKDELFQRAQDYNPWFTPQQLGLAWDGILKMLAPKALSEWVVRYPTASIACKVGVVMAGNIPLVGFHDFLCVLISGHQLVAKLSSQDSILPRFLADELVKVEPRFGSSIHFEERLNGVEAVIATGSDNTSRYFEYYFRKVPHIIRKNRSSCAIVMGEESSAALTELGKDVFSYFGLGCRNVSKVFIPDGFNPTLLLKSWEGFNSIAHHNKYINNYDYNKSIFLINQVPFFDNGFLLLTESSALVSPISVVYYQRYNDLNELNEHLRSHEEKLQCMVSANGWYKGSIAFGQAQLPGLSDYADNVDTMQFLGGLG